MKWRTLWRNSAMYIIAVVMIALDQWTKSTSGLHLPLNRDAVLILRLDRLFTFTHVQNTGSSFGILLLQLAVYSGGCRGGGGYHPLRAPAADRSVDSAHRLWLAARRRAREHGRPCRLRLCHRFYQLSLVARLERR